MNEFSCIAKAKLRIREARELFSAKFSKRPIEADFRHGELVVPAAVAKLYASSNNTVQAKQ